jgi:hypothetical protein
MNTRHPTGRDVLAELRAWHDPRYRRILDPARHDLRPRRTALPAAESIDLLHLDGAHGLPAPCATTSPTWLPRMSRRGVMLFHDIEARHSGFGVRQFWAEVARPTIPTSRLAFGHGLGVLAVGAEIHRLVCSRCSPWRLSSSGRWSLICMPWANRQPLP